VNGVTPLSVAAGWLEEQQLAPLLFLASVH
jgi:hypothetical protein